MIAAVTVLAAFVLGLCCRTRAAANTAYAVAYLWAFVFQTLYLLLDALDPGAGAPAFTPGEFPLSYGVVALAIFGIGFALVEGGHRVGTRRRTRRAVAVPA